MFMRTTSQLLHVVLANMCFGAVSSRYRLSYQDGKDLSGDTDEESGSSDGKEMVRTYHMYDMIR